MKMASSKQALQAFAPNALILALMCAASASFAGRLPERIATKFDFAGNPTQYSDPSAVLLLLPVVYALTLAVLPLAGARALKDSAQRQSFQVVLPRLLSAAGILLGSLHFGMLLFAWRPEAYPPALWITFAIGLFLLILGPMMEKTPPNPVFGIRTPWTLSSEKNWQATHRFAAKLMLVTGLFLVVYTVFARASLLVAVSSVLFATLMPVFYSLWYRQNMESA